MLKTGLPSEHVRPFANRFISNYFTCGYLKDYSSALFIVSAYSGLRTGTWICEKEPSYFALINPLQYLAYEDGGNIYFYHCAHLLLV